MKKYLLGLFLSLINLGVMASLDDTLRDASILTSEERYLEPILLLRDGEGSATTECDYRADSCLEYFMAYFRLNCKDKSGREQSPRDACIQKSGCRCVDGPAFSRIKDRLTALARAGAVKGAGTVKDYLGQCVKNTGEMIYNHSARGSSSAKSSSRKET